MKATSIKLQIKTCVHICVCIHVYISTKYRLFMRELGSIIADYNMYLCMYVCPRYIHELCNTVHKFHAIITDYKATWVYVCI